MQHADRTQKNVPPTLATKPGRNHLAVFSLVIALLLTLTACFHEDNRQAFLQELQKLPPTYNAYADEPTQEAQALYEKYQHLFSASDRKQIEMTPPLLEFKLRRELNPQNLDSNQLSQAAQTYENPFPQESLPYYMQYDQRWAFDSYSGGFLGETGCGPTSLAMVYVGLTGDTYYTPHEMGLFAIENGYSVKGNGSRWTLMSEGAEKLGLTASELPLWENSMREELAAGHPIIIIVGEGDFTSGGHYMVVRGATDEGFLLFDPYSLANSQKVWTYEQLEEQIDNLWAFSYEK